MTFTASDMPHACLFHIVPFSLSSSELTLLCRHRRGQKTETSSDASDEAPERAQKDTPKEANCIIGQLTLPCVFQVKFLRLPSDASHVRSIGYSSSPHCAGNLALRMFATTGASSLRTRNATNYTKSAAPKSSATTIKIHQRPIPNIGISVSNCKFRQRFSGIV